MKMEKIKLKRILDGGLEIERTVEVAPGSGVANVLKDPNLFDDQEWKEFQASGLRWDEFQKTKEGK